MLKSQPSHTVTTVLDHLKLVALRLKHSFTVKSQGIQVKYFACLPYS